MKTQREAIRLDPITHTVANCRCALNCSAITIRSIKNASMWSKMSAEIAMGTKCIPSPSLHTNFFSRNVVEINQLSRLIIGQRFRMWLGWERDKWKRETISISDKAQRGKKIRPDPWANMKQRELVLSSNWKRGPNTNQYLQFIEDDDSGVRVSSPCIIFHQRLSSNVAQFHHLQREYAFASSMESLII